jgi:hypothetical protein
MSVEKLGEVTGAVPAGQKMCRRLPRIIPVWKREKRK